MEEGWAGGLELTNIHFCLLLVANGALTIVNANIAS